MNKKYIWGTAGIVAILIAVVSFILLGQKCTLSVSAEQGYTISVKDVKLDDQGNATVRKGDKIVFAITLDNDYSDSDITVMANDVEVTGTDGVYRYTVEKNTVINIEGITKNDHIVQGIEMEPGTLDGEEFLLLRDENNRPVRVLQDLNMNAVDTFDVPDLDLIAYVNESINPGWKYRTLSEVNLGKYAATKFYVKSSNYLQAKLTFDEKDFYMVEGSDKWHEFLFKNEEGVMNIYVDGTHVGSCNYLSDVSLCLQNTGSYKFSNVYVVERDDYQGAQLTIAEGDGYWFDILPREYAVGAVLTFHVTIDDDFEKGASFAVKAGNQVLEPNADGSYTFTFTGNTALSVKGVVAKPLDSRYKVIGIPIMVAAQETTNYALLQSVKDGKTYHYTQEIWGSVAFDEITLEKYTDLLFYVKKEDSDETHWVELLQKADDGTVTPFLQKNDNLWHKVEIKKESGKMYTYVDGKRNDTPIIDAEHLYFVLSGDMNLRFTSLLGIEDPNYVEPEPDYLSTAYQVVSPPIAVVSTEIDNYMLVSKVPGAKTYEYSSTVWGAYDFWDITLDKYKELVFYIHKDDLNTKTWLEFYQIDDDGNRAANYLQKNDTRWYKVELKKASAGKFYVYVNGVKNDLPVASAQDLKFTLSADATLMYTSLFGIVDPNYVEEEPDYLSTAYKVVTSPIGVVGTEIDNYVLVSKIEDAKTYQYTSTSWGAYYFGNVSLDQYKELVFFIHKDDMNTQTWLEFYQVDGDGKHTADYLQKNDNRWYKIELKKASDGKVYVYVNGVKNETPITSMEDLRFTLSGGATLMYTSLFGIVDPSYVEEEPDYLSTDYQTIVPAAAVKATEITNYKLVSKIEDAKTYEYAQAKWGSFAFADVEFDEYTDLVFFVHKADVNTNTWLEFYQVDESGSRVANYLQENNNSWHKIEIKKNTTSGLFDVYVNGAKQEIAVSDASKLTFTLSGNSVLQFTSLFGIAVPGDSDTKPEQNNGMVVVSPWAYGEGKLDSTQTYTDGGYEYATVITGSNSTYGGALMMDADLSVYESFRFAVKSSGSYWEVGFVKNGNFGLFSGNATDWVEYEFKNEGNGYFQGYRNGSWFNVQIPLDANLSDLQMKFGTSGTLYLTEVRGIMSEGAVKILEVVADTFNAYTGDKEASETPNYLSTGSIKASTTWSAAKSPMIDLELGLYQKVLFYARKVEGSGWFESPDFGTAQLQESWTEFKLIKNSDGTWNLYRAGVQVSTNMQLSNLNEVSATYGTATYYFSEVFGVLGEMVEEPVISESMVVVSPWAYGKGKLDNTQTYNDGGYEYATVIPGSNSAYGGALMMDVDLSVYESFRFAVKSSGSYWEAGFVKNGNFGLFSGNATDWVEYEFKNEGNDYFQGYRNGSWFNVQIPLDANLSDLQMKFGTSGTLYLTEVRGIMSEGATRTLEVVADSFNTKAGTTVETERPNSVATKSTEVTTTWEASQQGLTSVDLSLYDKIVFYARKAGSDEKTGWFESTQLGSFVIEYNWTEFKLVKNADSTWNIYTGGVLKQSNQTLANLSEVTAKYGTNHYYFSEVFGVKGGSSSPDQGGDEALPVGEHIIVDAVWSYTGGTADDTQTYTDGGYEKATIVSGSSSTYQGAKLNDIDLSGYKEFRFALKTNGNYWYEIGLVSENSWNKIAKNDATWVEIKFVDEGNGYFQAYAGGKWLNWQLPLDSHLSDLQMRFSSNATSVLYLTEVRGTLK